MPSPTKRVISFGGWDFSTSPSTYNIFRQCVQGSNQNNFANTFVAIAEQFGVDGINIDWGYPGAPNIPGNSSRHSRKWAKFFGSLSQTIRARLPSGTSLSIAIPSSYWYLQHFPVYQMQDVVDYFVYMNYDYYGQWDYEKQG